MNAKLLNEAVTTEVETQLLRDRNLSELSIGYHRKMKGAPGYTMTLNEVLETMAAEFDAISIRGADDYRSEVINPEAASLTPVEQICYEIGFNAAKEMDESGK